jgi:hypothetical protein
LRTIAALVAVVAVAGCDSGSDDEASTASEPLEREPGYGRLIRDWSKAINAERYERAAAFFAPGAIVEQGREFRLEDRREAIVFNSTLPCKADVTDVDGEGDTLLAAFRLRNGPGGSCDGAARVRFRFRNGKFIEWRQLPEPDVAPGGTI